MWICQYSVIDKNNFNIKNMDLVALEKRKPAFNHPDHAGLNSTSIVNILAK